MSVLHKAKFPFTKTVLRAVMVAAFATIAHAQTGASLPEYQVVTAELPPLTASPASGAPAALSNITRALMRELGIKNDIAYMPWARAISAASNNPHTLILPFSRSPEREAAYRWVVKLYPNRLSFISLAERNMDMSDPQALKKMPFATVRGTPFIAQMQQAGAHNVNEVSALDQLSKMFQAKRIPLIFGAEASLLYILNNNGMTADQYKVSPPLATVEIWLAGSKDITDPEIAQWQQAMKRIKASGEYRKLLEQGGLPVPKED